MSKQKLFLLLIPIFLLVTVIAQAKGIKIPTSGETGLPDGGTNGIGGILSAILNWLLMIFVIIATISFVVTGLQFIFSFGGASGSEAQAKKNFTYTIIAIFIVGGSLIILKTIIGLLGPVSSGGAGGGNNAINTGGYPDNDAIEANNPINANNTAGQQSDASDNADNPTQEGYNPTIYNGGYQDNDTINSYNPPVPGSNELHQNDMPHNGF